MVIEKEPASISRHQLKEAPIEAQNGSHFYEGALTTWFYRCSNHLKYELKGQNSAKDLVSVRIIVTSVTMHIGLAIDVFLKAEAPSKVRTHEEGHVKICQIIYKNADALASQAAHTVLCGSFSGSGATYKQALENALQSASEAICLAYKHKTVERTNAISKAYDEITGGGSSNMNVDDAIAEAFKQTEGRQ